MYFKNPDVLYFLFLLIIPILVHLFQLQKFVKTPFTNVAFLKKIKLETRKSANIKKWLILAIRMLSFLSILLSFSQPYLGSKNTNKKQDIFIYLDNSLSLNTKGKRGDLLKIATQDIIKFAPTDRRYTLQTNNNYYTNIDYNNLKNQLLSLKNTSKTTTINTVIFKKTANQKKKTKTSNKNILISDFQNTYSFQFTNVTPLFSTVILQSSVKENLSIDTQENTPNFDASQSNRIDMLLSRMSQLEASFIPLSKNMFDGAQAQKEREALQKDALNLNEKLALLENRLATVETQAARDNTGLLLNLKIAELKKKVVSGEVYEKELETVRTLIETGSLKANNIMLAAIEELEKTAQAGLVTPDQLKRSFNGFIPDLISASNIDTSASWWQNTLNKLQNMISVRRTETST